LFKDYYRKEELRNFPNLHGVAQVSINGQPTTPFTIKIPFNFHNRNDSDRENIAGDIEELAIKSQKLYTKPLHEVEAIVDQRYEEVLQNLALVEEDEDMDYEAELSEELIGNLKDLVRR
jgi:hypothetical protein